MPSVLGAVQDLKSGQEEGAAGVVVVSHDPKPRFLGVARVTKYDTNPNIAQYTKGKFLKNTIHLQCLISSKIGNLVIPVLCEYYVDD